MSNAGDYYLPPRRDRVAFFRMSDTLRGVADRAVSSTLDAPAACPHSPAPLLCAAHIDLGPMCEECAAVDMLGHGVLLEATCSACRTLDISVTPAWVPSGEFTVLVRLCRWCRDEGVFLD